MTEHSGPEPPDDVEPADRDEEEVDDVKSLEDLFGECQDPPPGFPR